MYRERSPCSAHVVGKNSPSRPFHQHIPRNFTVVKRCFAAITVFITTLITHQQLLLQLDLHNGSSSSRKWNRAFSFGWLQPKPFSRVLEEQKGKMNPPICDENHRLHVTTNCIGYWLNNQPVITNCFIWFITFRYVLIQQSINSNDCRLNNWSDNTNGYFEEDYNQLRKLMVQRWR
jgi:hypothetical protein